MPKTPNLDFLIDASEIERSKRARLLEMMVAYVSHKVLSMCTAGGDTIGTFNWTYEDVEKFIAEYNTAMTIGDNEGKPLMTVSWYPISGSMGLPEQKQ